MKTSGKYHQGDSKEYMHMPGIPGVFQFPDIILWICSCIYSNGTKWNGSFTNFQYDGVLYRKGVQIAPKRLKNRLCPELLDLGELCTGIDACFPFCIRVILPNFSKFNTIIAATKELWSYTFITVSLLKKDNVDTNINIT